MPSLWGARAFRAAALGYGRTSHAVATLRMHKARAHFAPDPCAADKGLSGRRARGRHLCTSACRVTCALVRCSVCQMFLHGRVRGFVWASRELSAVRMFSFELVNGPG